MPKRTAKNKTPSAAQINRAAAKAQKKWVREFVEWAKGDPTLTKWEEGFIKSLSQRNTPRKFSPKQIYVVKQLVRKLDYPYEIPSREWLRDFTRWAKGNPILSWWEATFIGSISNYVEYAHELNKCRISVRQAKKIAQIADKLGYATDAPVMIIEVHEAMEREDAEIIERGEAPLEQDDQTDQEQVELFDPVF